MNDDVRHRAAVHAALGEPVRLGFIDELALSDRAPSDLATRFGLPGNLVAHHLDVLVRVGLVERVVSSGDRRRRYVRLRGDRLPLPAALAPRRRGRALFVCTHNSARSQLAAALWRARTGDQASSAGTQPANEVHPGAVAAAARAGLDLSNARPRALAEDDLSADVVVTVCDVAHEALDSLDPHPGWLHWSVPDPVVDGSAQAFDDTLALLDQRVTAVAGATDTTE